MRLQNSHSPRSAQQRTRDSNLTQANPPQATHVLSRQLATRCCLTAASDRSKETHHEEAHYCCRPGPRLHCARHGQRLFQSLLRCLPPVRRLSIIGQIEVATDLCPRDEGRSRSAKVLTFDEARRIAVNVARLPELLGDGPQSRRSLAIKGRLPRFPHFPAQRILR
jgi:hypothetical protein